MARTNIRPARPTLGSSGSQATLDLYRRKPEADLLCAVPEGDPLPGFLDARTWQFIGALKDPTTVLSDFNRTAAEASVRVNGFYLFEAGLVEPDFTITRRGERPRAEGHPPRSRAPVALSYASTGITRREARAS
ncbi:MAG TPA: hypothetical protein VHG30_12245 [Microvirga sp.]|nr:hypothetical protein [Microvirga sp.]